MRFLINYDFTEYSLYVVLSWQETHTEIKESEKLKPYSMAITHTLQTFVKIRRDQR